MVLALEVLESSVGVTSRFPHKVILISWHLAAVPLPSGGHRATFCHWHLSRHFVCGVGSPFVLVYVFIKEAGCFRRIGCQFRVLKIFFPQSSPQIICSLFTSLLEYNEHKSHVTEGNPPCPQPLFPFVLSVLVCKRVPHRNYWLQVISLHFLCHIVLFRHVNCFFFFLFVIIVNSNQSSVCSASVDLICTALLSFLAERGFPCFYG